ncbi:MAG TPA: flagellar hook protein FlgE [Humidesulfovibrio sp.]|uniref:flagellar hook protein FlgE n=1 Tax=Humidesulfovibrio sp. TaxID=2910988 RepID=UPI002C5CFA23|nr:flagellar hook protein FlgE [Humidesulfovibrio sp.]HWR04057.1 flagellar hook protein FlgE [Humidesulfovibrio sp.]
MSLTSSLYQGITGMQAHSQAISVIGNNLANVSTTGYKGSNIFFQDLISQDISTAAGNSQMGLGVQVAAIYADFSQGAIETTTEATDLALGGKGFFTVKAPNSDNTYYTRAGNFRFSSDGYLVDTNGNRVQGWAMQKATTTSSSSTDYSIYGSPTDVLVSNFQSPASATTKINMVTNLNPSSTSQCDSTTDPYFAMFKTWNGQADTPLSSTNYGYSNTIKVYDSTGTSHNVTVYYDKVTMTSNAGADTVWEYMVTCNPSDDGRTIGGTSLKGTSGAGVLMIGTMTFRSGQMVGQSAYTLKSNATGDLKDTSQWTLADFSNSGYPMATANFIQASNASAATSVSATPISVDFGMRSKDRTWTQAKGAIASNASAVGTKTSSAGWVPNMGNPAVSALSTQSYDTGGFSTLFQNQDGYTAGYLQNVSVSANGVLSGTFSNGQEMELYTLTITSFTNQWGLRREGNNLFSETRDSGSALTGTAKSGGRGSVTSNALESSNVDMASEFVDLITAQRGFQANSKVITTADTLLGEVIAMKR